MESQGERDEKPLFILNHAYFKVMKRLVENGDNVIVLT